MSANPRLSPKDVIYLSTAQAKLADLFSICAQNNIGLVASQIADVMRDIDAVLMVDHQLPSEVPNVVRH